MSKEPIRKSRKPPRLVPSQDDLHPLGQQPFWTGVATYDQGKLQDPKFRASLEQMLLPFYKDPTSLLDRELTHCNKAYVVHRRDGNLLAIALFAYEIMDVPGKGFTPSLYIGLSASHWNFRQRGLILRLWLAASWDAQRWEKERGCQLLTWATTPSPDAYWGATVFLDVEPLKDGKFSSESLVYVDAIRRTMKFGPRNGKDHPFVLRRVAHNTCYTDEEAERIRTLSESKGLSLFSNLGINERRGDRLLMIGRVKNISPATFRRRRWRQL